MGAVGLARTHQLGPGIAAPTSDRRPRVCGRIESGPLSGPGPDPVPSPGPATVPARPCAKRTVAGGIVRGFEARSIVAGRRKRRRHRSSTRRPAMFIQQASFPHSWDHFGQPREITSVLRLILAAKACEFRKNIEYFSGDNGSWTIGAATWANESWRRRPPALGCNCVVARRRPARLVAAAVLLLR